jgi:hypothetical protein
MNIMNKISKVAVLVLAAAVLGCNGELNEGSAPVELIATSTQNISTIDLDAATAVFDAQCFQNIGTIALQVQSKGRTDLTGPANQVRVTRYRVSYQRRDGGRLVPAPFVRPMDVLIAEGGAAGISNFVVLERDAVTQAPFAALFPQNGGRDPDTNRSIIEMDVIMEFYGETLGGDNVYDATRFPLDFCFNCGGCA